MRQKTYAQKRLKSRPASQRKAAQKALRHSPSLASQRTGQRITASSQREPGVTENCLPLRGAPRYSPSRPSQKTAAQNEIHHGASQKTVAQCSCASQLESCAIESSRSVALASYASSPEPCVTKTKGARVLRHRELSLGENLRHSQSRISQKTPLRVGMSSVS